MSTSIMITGASSGIGKALALELASRGYSLGLAARRKDGLDALAAEIRQRHGDGFRVETRPLDVTDYDAVPRVLQEFVDALGGLDIVFANAGIGSEGRIGDGHFEDARRTIETNVIGAMATVDAAAAYFLERGHGHVVATSSVAAFRGLPGSSAYCASKAALTTYMGALRAETWKRGIAVTVLHPGYIDTPINSTMASRPFLITVDKGARLIADMIERRVPSATVPVWPWNVIGRVLRWLPTGLIARMG
ncbi:MAG TPA: SDR family oxidoreductase [Gammaproteobacteria bacterium]|nr:SDR family oxidoreductase [Gammaproteobacteria bacterium]